jgi:hypothetical protein
MRGSVGGLRSSRGGWGRRSSFWGLRGGAWRLLVRLGLRLRGGRCGLRAYGSRLQLTRWLHGDAVQFSTDSLMIISCGSLLCMRSSLDASLLICAWPKAATVHERQGQEGGTWSAIWPVIVWSFQCLWAGVHPDADWLGRPRLSRSRLLCISCGLSRPPALHQRSFGKRVFKFTRVPFACGRRPGGQARRQARRNQVCRFASANFRAP